MNLKKLWKTFKSLNSKSKKWNKSNISLNKDVTIQFEAHKHAKFLKVILRTRN